MFGLFKKKSINSSSQEIVLSLSGLHCSSCAVSIDLALEDLSGVEKSQTNFARSQTKVIFDSSKINPKTIVKAIKNLGYQAK